MIKIKRMRKAAVDDPARFKSSRTVGALARKIVVVLHRMWVDGSDFRPG